MKKKTAIVKCRLYEEKGVAHPKVEAEGDRYSLLLAIVGIMRAYIKEEIADAWALQKLVEYADQPDEEARAKFMKKFEKEYREKLIKEMEEAWHDAKRNYNSKQQARDSKEDNKQDHTT